MSLIGRVRYLGSFAQWVNDTDSVFLTDIRVFLGETLSASLGHQREIVS